MHLSASITSPLLARNCLPESRQLAIVADNAFSNFDVCKSNYIGSVISSKQSVVRPFSTNSNSSQLHKWYLFIVVSTFCSRGVMLGYTLLLRIQMHYNQLDGITLWTSTWYSSEFDCNHTTMHLMSNGGSCYAVAESHVQTITANGSLPLTSPELQPTGAAGWAVLPHWRNGTQTRYSSLAGWRVRSAWRGQSRHKELQHVEKDLDYKMCRWNITSEGRDY